VPGKADEAHLAGLSCFHGSFHAASGSEDALRIVHAYDFVKLKQVNVVGLQPLERLVDLFGRGLGVAAIDLGHEEDLLAIAVAQRLAHAYFTVAVVVVPAVVHEGDAVVDRSANDLDGLSLTGIADVIAAETEHRHWLAGMAQSSGRNATRVRGLRDIAELGDHSGGNRCLQKLPSITHGSCAPRCDLLGQTLNWIAVRVARSPLETRKLVKKRIGHGR